MRKSAVPPQTPRCQRNGCLHEHWPHGQKAGLSASPPVRSVWRLHLQRMAASCKACAAQGRRPAIRPQDFANVAPRASSPSSHPPVAHPPRARFMLFTHIYARLTDDRSPQRNRSNRPAAPPTKTTQDWLRIRMVLRKIAVGTPGNAGADQDILSARPHPGLTRASAAAPPSSSARDIKKPR